MAVTTVNLTDVLNGEDEITIINIIEENAILLTDALTPVSGTNKVITQADMSQYGGGDMVKAVYDTNDDGQVDAADNADTVNGLTVLTAVPSGAVFTDTKDHTLFTNIGTHTHAQIDTHIDNNTIHFTQAAISITGSQVSDLSTILADYLLHTDALTAVDVDNKLITEDDLASSLTTVLVDTDALSPVTVDNKLITEDDLSSANLDDEVVQVSTYANLPVTGATETIYIVADTDTLYRWSGSAYNSVGGGGVTDHTLLTNIGTNTHAQIDTHIADGTKHFTEGSISHANILNIGTNTHAQIDSHIANTSNPHGVDKADVGLSNVDNTSDATKNVLSATKLTTARTITFGGDVTGNFVFDGSTDLNPTINIVDDSHNHVISNIDGLQTALDGKADDADIIDDHTQLLNIGTNTHAQIDSHIANTSNPHAVDKADVGLSNVDNTADSVKVVASAGKWTTARTITLAGDISGSALIDGSSDVTFVNIAVADDSHNHVISNIDGLQTALDGKADNADIIDDHTLLSNIGTNTHAQIDSHIASTDNPHGVDKTDVGLSNVDNTADAVKVVAEAAELTTARDITLSGDVTGSTSFDGSQNVTITTVVGNDTHAHTFANLLAIPDSTITLTGDVSGVGTMIDLGNTSITVTVADDSHNHIIANVDGLQAILDSKADSDALGDLNELFADTNEPSGFVRESPNTMGIMEYSEDGTNFHRINQYGAYSYHTSQTYFGDGTTPVVARKFVIYPVSGQDLEVYIEGVKARIQSTKSVTIPATSGMHYVYFDETTALNQATTFAYDYFEENPIVAFLYVNTVTNALVEFADERHGVSMDGATHRYLHFTRGAQYVSGMGVNGFVEDGTTHGQLDAGVMYDEDIFVNTPNQATAPFWYINNTTWDKKTASNLLAFTDSGDTRIAWNSETGGVWSLTEAAQTNDCFVIFLVATNNAEYHYVKIIPQTVFTSVSQARAGIEDEINNLVLSGLPASEFMLMGAYIVNGLGELQLQEDGSIYLDLRQANIATSAGASGVVSDHFTLANIGTYTHYDIDDHINDATIHFEQGDISITESQISDLQNYALDGHTHSTYDRSTADLSGATVFDNITVLDGIVTAIATRDLTAADIGAATSGHTHSTYDYSGTPLTGAYVFSDINVVDGIVTGEITTRQLTAGDIGAATSAHTHSTFDFTSPLTGATVLADLDVTDGIVTTASTRTLTPADIGAATSGHTHSTYDYSATALTGAYVFSDINVVDGIVTGEITTRQLTPSDIGAQAAGTYNTIIGTDTDISYTGATVLSTMTLTDGVVQGHTSRTLTAADIGAATSSHDHDSAYISIVATPTTGNFPQLTATGELVNSIYDETSFATASHTHSTYDYSAAALTGATVFSDINVVDGIVTGEIATRTLTLANLGYTGATDADKYTSWIIKGDGATTYPITSGDTLNIIGGTDIDVTATADDTLTVAFTGTVGDANQNAFSNVAVSGQTTVAADTPTDTLTLVAGTNVTITTNATNDSVTINSTAGGGIGEYINSSIAIGYDSLALDNDDGTDNNNIGIGNSTGRYLTTGAWNIFIGDLAGVGNSGFPITGTNNIALGEQALRDVIGGSSNIAMGYLAAENLTTGGNNIALGNYALGGDGVTAVTSAQSIALGTEALQNTTDGQYNVSLGYRAGKNITSGDYNFAVGYSALLCGTSDLTGNHNIGIGYWALSELGGATSNNVGIGNSAGSLMISGEDNVFIGRNTGYELETGNGNVVIGPDAGGGSGGGSFGAGYQDYNILIGSYAGFDITSGFSNVCIGEEAGLNLTTGDLNVGLGYRALGGETSAGVTGTSNICIGVSAGGNLTSGQHNVFIGDQMGMGVTTGSNLMEIGGGQYNETPIAVDMDTSSISWCRMTLDAEVTVTQTIMFDGLYDNGTKSTNWTMNLSNGQYQKVTMSADQTLTITPQTGKPCTVYLHITQSGAGNTLTLPSGMWEGGTAGANTETDGALDILMIHYTGSAYVFNYMNDVS